MNDTPPQEVLRRHLELSRFHSEEDFLTCYREDSFLIMPSGVRRGLEGIRDCYRQLNRELPNARYTYKVVVVEQHVGLLEWSADSDTHTVTDGVDSYVIEDGYIRAQTVHYTLVPKSRG
ncbi:MAG: nuclear transport factor 2 family protein [Gemmataceae bacterium]|nr:nuclear transport factor 2 family protein [Gemmataceae bacterium]